MMDCNTIMSSDEEETMSRRYTRTLKEKDIQYHDKEFSSRAEEDDSSAEESDEKILTTDEIPPTPCSEIETSKDLIGKVKGMTAEQVNELLAELSISEGNTNEGCINNLIKESESNSLENMEMHVGGGRVMRRRREKEALKEEDTERKVYKEEKEEETYPGLDEEQKKKPQKIQAKKTKKVIAKQADEEVASNLESKLIKPILEAKRKKNNSKSANVDAQSEEELNKLENKKKGAISDSNHDECLNKMSKTKTNEILSETIEKKSTKSKNDKANVGSNKEKQVKPAKKVGNSNLIKESESNTLENMETHEGGGRVMRARRGKEALKEVNEPIKSSSTETIMGQPKINRRKPELKTTNPEGNTDSANTNEELKSEQKKKTGTKVAKDIKKPEEEEGSVSTVNSSEGTSVKVIKNKKKVPLKVKEPQENSVSSTIKDVKPNRQRKNHNKNISEVAQDVVQKELNTAVKNAKSKKVPKNSEATTIADGPQIGTGNTEKTKLKSDIVKNKKLIDNKENEMNEETMPKRRAARNK